LRRDAALLDREGGDVAGRVDVVDPEHAAVAVHRHEALDSLRDAVDPAADEARERHHPVGGDDAVRHQPQLAVTQLAGV
jgi:hypothetical protein